MKGVFVQCNGRTERFVNDENYEYQFDVSASGVLNVYRTSKKGGAVRESRALFFNGVESCCVDDVDRRL